MLEEKTTKQQNFLAGAAVLSQATMIVKVIGMFFKIPLNRLIGEANYGYFTTAYDIYTVLLMISTTGLPVAMSRMISEARALNNGKQVRQIYRVSLMAFLSIGIIGSALLLLIPKQLANMMESPNAMWSIFALGPAVLFVCYISACRGFFQGQGNMAPTAVSQIIEALCKLTVGLGRAYWLVGHGADASHAAAGAITGVTVGTIVALAYMLMNFLITRGREGNLSDDQPDDAPAILKNLLMIAVPLTISSSMVGIVTVIDSSLVQGQLQRALLENPDTWALYQGIVDFTDLEQALKAWKAALPQGGEVTMALLEQSMAGQGGQAEAALALHTTLEGISRTLYGNYNGALNIYNLPTSLMAAVTAAVIPAVSGALARRDRRGAGRITGSALRITALVACPMAVGLYVLGKPIMALIFPSLNADLAGPLLSTLGLATLFVCMMLVCNSILQAHGFVNLPVAIMLMGGVVKIFTNYHVVVVPSMGIYGAPMGNILCFALCMVLDLVVIARVLPRRPSYFQVFAKPAAASALMGLGAWAVYGLMAKGLIAGGKLCEVDRATQEIVGLSRTGNGLAVICAILVAVAVYGILVIALRAITREDLSLMPKGEKIARILHLS